ncbi:MAG: DUF4265 domain-containing protein [Alphaproteobacteria bacterium]|nr:DUF4265 domain-containing protein [Alphaproteobacteria bacterium]
MADQLVKVRFELDSSDWHGHGSETLWAAPITTDPGHFRIANSPFFTKGINHQDVVEAVAGEDRRVFEFNHVAKRAGHSTYMLIIEADEATFRPYWNMLEEKGCTYESTHIVLSMGRRLLLSVDVPPSANILEVFNVLERGEADSVWLFQQGYAYLPKQ